jgi:hypothetical protein
MKLTYNSNYIGDYKKYMNDAAKASSEALESNASGTPYLDKIINVDNTPMHLSILTDEIIQANHLKKVDNPIMFERKRF